MERINVIAKISGLHPATGLYLEQGNEYSIDKALFSAEVFTPAPIQVTAHAAYPGKLTVAGSAPVADQDTADPTKVTQTVDNPEI